MGTHSSGNSPASNMVSTKLIVLALVVVVVALADAAPRFFIIDDGLPDESALRVRRDTDIAATNVHGGAYHRGKVGPVYSFVKTDPKADFYDNQPAQQLVDQLQSERFNLFLRPRYFVASIPKLYSCPAFRVRFNKHRNMGNLGQK